jgi:hypothetical protein
MNLISLRVRYESVCDKCGEAETVKNRAARGLARKHFGAAQFKQQLFMALRLLPVLAVISAAVVLPLTIRIPLSRDPEVLKGLVSEDGDYAVKDGSDELLAIIHVEGGAATLLWYDKVSELTGTGSKRGRFYLHEFYQEASDAAGNTILIRDIDDPGRLMDQYNSVVRLYDYNEETDVMTFYQGVEDLSAIQYETGRVSYPNISFDEEGGRQQYLTVLYLLSNAQLRAQFSASTNSSGYDTLYAVNIDTSVGGRVTDQRNYYFDDNAISLARQAGLSPESEAQAFADFIRENSLSPILTYQYEYYGNTDVIQTEVSTLPDENGDMQTTTTEYDITAINGYYLVKYEQ